MSVNPADGAVLGALYGTDAMRAVMGERALLVHMLEAEAALARAQARLGIVPAEAAAAITAAAEVDRLDLAALRTATRNTGYPVVGLVRQLERLAGEGAARWVHWGATTQDILDTALVLQLREGFALVRAELAAVCAALARLAREHRETVMAGRTHLQHALPVTFGYKCAVWLSPLLSCAERLRELRPRLERVQLGGAAGTLASLGERGLEVQHEFAAELGLGVPDIPWHVARDAIAEAVCVAGILCGALAKIATDVMLLMQTEVSEAFEPRAPGRGGSSSMPQKRNPIACEYVLAQARGVHALVPLVLGAMAQDQERGTGPWQAEPLAVPQAMLLTHGALAQTRFLLEGLVVDPARMRANLASTGGLIAAEQVMMGLAPLMGRGAAHDAVHHACDVALAEHAPLADALAREEGVTRHLGPDEIARLCAPESYLGSAPGFTDRVLARWEATAR